MRGLRLREPRVLRAQARCSHAQASQAFGCFRECLQQFGCAWHVHYLVRCCMHTVFHRSTALTCWVYRCIVLRLCLWCRRVVQGASCTKGRSASRGAKLELAIGRPLDLIYPNCTAKFVAPECSFALCSLFAAGWPSLVRQLLAQDCLGGGRSFQ